MTIFCHQLLHRIIFKFIKYQIYKEAEGGVNDFTTTVNSAQFVSCFFLQFKVHLGPSLKWRIQQTWTFLNKFCFMWIRLVNCRFTVWKKKIFREIDLRFFPISFLYSNIDQDSFFRQFVDSQCGKTKLENIPWNWSTVLHINI